MANPYSSQAKSGSAAKMKSMTGRATGGAVYSGEAFARGGKAKSKGHKGTNIKIMVVAPGADKKEGPEGMPPPMMPPRPPMAPPPGMGPPGAPPGGPPPGMPPMKRGGAAYKRGGMVHMTAGAANGVGLKQKMRAYGLKPIKNGD